LTAQRVTVAGVPVLALRVSYVGELGWELHADLDRFGDLYRAVSEAGKSFGLAPFGIYAVNAMRLEKGYRGWGADLTTERTPLEAGLQALVRTEGRSFIGREAMLARAASETAWRMALFSVEDDGISLPFYNHTVWQDDQAVGVVTSGAYGFRTGKPLVLAYLTPKATAAPMRIRVIDRDLAITELKAATYDPDNLKPRGIEAAVQQIKKVG